MKFFIIILFFFSPSIFADSKIPGQFSFSIGSISANYAESATQSSTTGTSSTATTTTPFSGTASSMPFAIGYEYFPNLQRAYFARVSGPLLGSTPDRYYSGTGGINFYFGKVASLAVVSDTTFEMKIIPKIRYYAGPSAGIGYIVYHTPDAIKNDLMFELGGQAGMLYTLNQKWSLRAEAGGARGIGALVSATIIKILIGASYNL